jgi:hypothetical protein
MRWEVWILRHKVIVDVFGFLQRIVSRSDIAFYPFAFVNFQKDAKLLYQDESWVTIFAFKILKNIEMILTHYPILSQIATAQMLSGWTAIQCYGSGVRSGCGRVVALSETGKSCIYPTIGPHKVAATAMISV